MPPKSKAQSKLDKIESYFTREDSAHDNGFYFDAYTRAKKSGIFEDLEVPLLLMDKAVSTFIEGRLKPLHTAAKFMEILEEHSPITSQKIIVLENIINYIGNTEFSISEDKSITFYDINGLLRIEKGLLEAKAKEVLKTPLLKPVKTESNLTTYTNSQLVLIFYYFFKQSGLTPRESIDIAPIAKFMHLVTGKEFTAATNSDFYKKLQTVPNFKSDKSLIDDLETIKPLFKKVQLNEVVKMIDNEIEMARGEVNQRRKNK